MSAPTNTAGAAPAVKEATPEQKAEALKFKDAGNKAFKAGEWADAIKLYSEVRQLVVSLVCARCGVLLAGCRVTHMRCVSRQSRAMAKTTCFSRTDPRRTCPKELRRPRCQMLAA